MNLFFARNVIRVPLEAIDLVVFVCLKEIHSITLSGPVLLVINQFIADCTSIIITFLYYHCKLVSYYCVFYKCEFFFCVKYFNCICEAVHLQFDA